MSNDEGIDAHAKKLIGEDSPADERIVQAEDKAEESRSTKKLLVPEGISLPQLRENADKLEQLARSENAEQLRDKAFWLKHLLGGSVFVLIIVWFLQGCIYLSLLYFPEDLNDATTGDGISLLLVPTFVFVNLVPMFVFGVAFLGKKAGGLTGLFARTTEQ